MLCLSKHIVKIRLIQRFVLMDPVLHFPLSLDRSTIASRRNQTRQGRCRTFDSAGAEPGYARDAECTVGTGREEAPGRLRHRGSGGVGVVAHRGPGTRSSAGKDDKWMAL